MPEPRWLDETQQRAWRGVLTMHTELTAELGRRLQADAGLSLSDFAVLVALTDRREQRLRVLELAEALQWEKSRLSHQLARMQRRGLLTRQDCPDDARGALVVLTDQGRAAIERAAPQHAADVHRLVFDHLTAEQIETLRTISATVLDQLHREPQR